MSVLQSKCEISRLDNFAGIRRRKRAGTQEAYIKA